MRSTPKSGIFRDANVRARILVAVPVVRRFWYWYISKSRGHHNRHSLGALSVWVRDPKGVVVEPTVRDLIAPERILWHVVQVVPAWTGQCAFLPVPRIE